MKINTTLSFPLVYSGNYYLTSQNIAFEWKNKLSNQWGIRNDCNIYVSY